MSEVISLLLRGIITLLAEESSFIALRLFGKFNNIPIMNNFLRMTQDIVIIKTKLKGERVSFKSLLNAFCSEIPFIFHIYPLQSVSLQLFTREKKK